MRVIITENFKALSLYAAQQIAMAIRRKPNLVLGLATGRTPIGTYEELVKMHREEGLDFSKVVTFNLDEYHGLKPTDPSSYNYFMWEHLFKHININPENVYIPDGTIPVTGIREYCLWYENRINFFGGIDLQLLGIGNTGHIGFNDPGSSLASDTRLKVLSLKTKKQNGPDFGGADKVPDCAITMGIGTIMQAKTIILLASGSKKARILARALEEPVTSLVPASILQMHPWVKIVADEEAASKLRWKNHYRRVEEVRKRIGYEEVYVK